MELTPKDIQALRIIIQRAVGDCFDVVAAASMRSSVKAGVAEVAAIKAKEVAVGPPPAVLPRKGLYSIRETSELLGLGRSSIYELISRGKLIPVKIGKRTLIPAGVVEAIISKGLM